eukprot:1148336-Pelagomonas_calceolata.AAC.1
MVESTKTGWILGRTCVGSQQMRRFSQRTCTRPCLKSTWTKATGGTKFREATVWCVTIAMDGAPCQLLELDDRPLKTSNGIKHCTAFCLGGLRGRLSLCQAADPAGASLGVKVGKYWAACQQSHRGQAVLSFPCLQFKFKSPPKTASDSGFSFIAFGDMGQADDEHNYPGLITMQRKSGLACVRKYRSDIGPQVHKGHGEG